LIIKKEKIMEKIIKHRKLVQYFVASVSAMCLSVAAQSAFAADTLLNYTLQGVTFSDGTTASGTFTWDSTTNTVEAANITTQSGPQLGGYDYTLSDSSASSGPFGAPADASFLIQALNGSQYLSLVFDTTLANAGTDQIDITGEVSPGSYECSNCGSVRAITAGDAFGTAVQVPEPFTASLLAVGLLGLFAFHRRNKSSV
jgi:hypothetical protein